MIEKHQSKAIRFVLLICLLLILFSQAEGGQRNVQEILKAIETCDPAADRAKLIELIGLLWAPAARFVSNYDEFIGESTMEDIEKATYEDRLDVIRILVPLINRKDPILTNEIAAAFSYYNYPPAKQMLSDYPDGPQKAVFYAILGHGRSYRWAVDQYEKIGRGGSDSIKSAVVEKLAYLNLLYFLAQPESLPFVRRVEADSEILKIRERAARVRDRIMRLHPEIK
jgi:hypothetical protein